MNFIFIPQYLNEHMLGRVGILNIITIFLEYMDKWMNLLFPYGILYFIYEYRFLIVSIYPYNVKNISNLMSNINYSFCTCRCLFH